MGARFERRHQVGVIVWAVAMAGCVGEWTGQQRSGRAPGIRLPQHIDIGPVLGQPGHIEPIRVPVSNESRSPVEVRVATVSSPCCLRVEQGQLTLAPGKKGELQLGLRLSHFRERERAWVGVEWRDASGTTRRQRVLIEGMLLPWAELRLGDGTYRIAAPAGAEVARDGKLILRYDASEPPAAHTIPVVETDEAKICLEVGEPPEGVHVRGSIHEVAWPVKLKLTMPPMPGTRSVAFQVSHGQRTGELVVTLEVLPLVRAYPSSTTIARCRAGEPCPGHLIRFALVTSNDADFAVGVPRSLPAGAGLQACQKVAPGKWEIQLRLDCTKVTEPLALFRIPLRGVAQREVRFPALLLRRTAGMGHDSRPSASHTR